MNYKYTLAHGAKQNVGDFLIRDRAISLLEEYTDISKEELYSVDLVRNKLVVLQSGLDFAAGTLN